MDFRELLFNLSIRLISGLPVDRGFFSVSGCFWRDMTAGDNRGGRNAIIVIHASSLTKACKLGDAICMNQGSALPAAHCNRDGRNCSLLGRLIHQSLSDPRVAVFLRLPTAAGTSALATILDSDEGKNFREAASHWILEATPALQDLRHRPKEALEALSGNERWFRVTDSSWAELNGNGVYFQ